MSKPTSASRPGSPSTIVSGAASGIGRHMAVALARAGHRLTLTDIDGPGLAALAAEQGWREGSEIMLRTLDVRDSAGWTALVADTVERFGSLDLMLNIAGYLQAGYVTEIDSATVDRHIDINVKGVIYATQAGARQMVRQKSGHIINLASIAGLSHVPGLAVYCASKHAVRGFSLSVAHELEPHGVALSVLCPDAVETPMLLQQEAHPEASMTFGAGRALTLQEVEAALFGLIARPRLELVLDVPRSGRALGAKLANTLPWLTGIAIGTIQRRGQKAQQQRLRGARPGS